MGQSKDVKRIDIKEFREKGYLQEVNRQFLHPLGLALEIIADDDGNEKLGGIWDGREDPEGIYYDLQNSSVERNKKFFENRKFVLDEARTKEPARIKLFGSVIEPIKIHNE